jgi:voltage-gated potassium channel
MNETESKPRQTRLTQVRIKLYDIIYESDTPMGKLFDILLIASIIISIIAIMLDSVVSIHQDHKVLLYRVEWFFTALFTIEYLLRIFCNLKPLKYIFSFYGLIDLISIIPTYLSLIITNSQYLLIIRALRVLRVFRVMKLGAYVSQANLLSRALLASKQKVIVFLFFISTLVLIFGSIMYLIEGPSNGFTSIPRSVYWAIVTLTTVGYGDIAPQTSLGQALASLVMIMGYAIIAVPTGIFTAELSNALKEQGDKRECPECGSRGHRIHALFCDRCGHHL